jgi:signal recognition particle subunit SRP54
MASRILGMGDVLSLVEEAQRKVDHKDAQKLATKLNKGKGFDLDDLRAQMLQMQKMGGMGGLMDKLPGMGKMTQAAKDGAGDKEVGKMVAIINSMTPQERRFPVVIKGSRKKRIALGSGLQIQDVNRLLKQHKQMSKMMKKFKGGGLKKMMRGMKGQMPPGMGGGGFPGM